MKTVLLLLVLCPFALRAQFLNITPEDIQRRQSYLLLRDGSVVRGRIRRQDSTIITVRQRGGVLTFVEADQLIRITPNRPDAPPPVAPIYAAAPYQVFVLKDGSQVEGKFVRRDSTMISVRKRNGQLTYFEPELLNRVDSVRVGTGTELGSDFMTQFSPWLLAGLTAHNAEKGRFYYRNTWLLLNEFDYGITRYWSIGTGFLTPIPGLIYADAYSGSGQYWATPSRLFTKLSAPIGQKLRLGINATYQAGKRNLYPAGRGVWTLQAVATVGSRQRNVTISYGIAVPRGQVLSYTNLTSSSIPPQYTYVKLPNQQFLSVGIMEKVARNLTFVTDNRLNVGPRYDLYTPEQLSVSAALRLDRLRHAFDLGVYGLIFQRPYYWGGRRTHVFPYVGYNLLIGRD